jgi:hypothetical protein
MTEMADIYLGLRSQFLATAPAEVDGGAPVYALLFEVEANGTIVTTAATAAGDASVYFSKGGGAIGGIGIAEVRDAAKALVASAAALLDRTEPTTITAPPSPGELSLILLTDRGPRVLRAAIASKFQPGDPLLTMVRDSGALTTMLLRAPPAATAVGPA